MLHIAVVGSTEFIDVRPVAHALTRLMGDHGDITIVSGGADGADSIGEAFALANGCPAIIHLADWAREHTPWVGQKRWSKRYQRWYDPRAGHERNTYIVEDADIVLCFYTGAARTPGTKDTHDKANAAGKPVFAYHGGLGWKTNQAARDWEHAQ